MTDPRNTDPRYYDPPRDSQLSDPVLRRRDPSADRLWGWIAGIAVVVLIGFIVVAGWNGANKNTAGNGPAATTGSATHSAPATTGAAPMAPRPSPSR